VPTGVATLVVGPDGRKLYGSGGSSGQWFEYDPDRGPHGQLRHLGPVYGESTAPGPENVGALTSLTLGKDGKFYLAGHRQRPGLIAGLGPSTGQRFDVGQMSCGGKEIRATVSAVCTGADGKLYFAGFRPGCGLYVYPPLSESPPWTNSKIAYDCHRVEDDVIRIDGSVRETAWRRANRMENFRVSASAKPARFASVSRLLWSGKRLFLAFECKTDAIRSTLTKRDDEIWNEETAELYLCPRGFESKYYEIDFNPQNAIYDSLISDYRYSELATHYKKWALSYNAKIESATLVQRDRRGKVTGWSLEAAIPFEDLREADCVPPAAGDLWLFNLCRVAQIGAKDCEYSAWQPTHADFHKPWEFPRLRFVE
jgi:hypothetical protein